MAEQSQAYASAAQGVAAEKLAEEKKPEPERYDLPLRQYMDSFVVPALLPALNAVANERPDNPVEWLAEYLLKNNPARANQGVVDSAANSPEGVDESSRAVQS